MEIIPIDWSQAFKLETHLSELVLRSVTLYFAILFFFRLIPRRTGGDLATMDLVFLIIIGNAAGRAVGDFNSVTDALVVIASLIVCNYTLNILSFYFHPIERLISAPPLLIIKNGRVLRRNLRREYITEEELMTHLRRQGIDTIKSVKAAYIDGEGRIDVIRFPSADK